MSFLKSVAGIASTALFAVVIAVAGCDNSESNTAAPSGNATGSSAGAAQSQDADQPKPATQPLIPMAQMIDWCREHAMPESICVQCNPNLAAGLKAKGDWDEAHNLPKSQCFQCDPSLKDKFAAAFKEKTGKEPPAAE